jgi:dihydrofolate reductase
MHITEVMANIEGADTFFPEFDRSLWKETERVHHPADEKHQYAFDFVTYEKK